MRTRYAGPRIRGFRPDVRGTYVDRPNRFTARVLLNGQLVAVHCPNPGRLTELLFPGDPVVLERALTPRKLAFTLVAVERNGPVGVVTIPLVSVRASPAVGALFLPVLFPGARMMRSEFALGSSRFDGLVEDAEWGEAGYVPHVVFAVVHGRPRSWGPNVHTDPGFARTLAALAPRLHLHAVVFETLSDGATRLVDPALPFELTETGPDSGHLVRLVPSKSGWTFGVEWYPAGFEKTVAKAPARSSFPIRGVRDRRDEPAAELASSVGPETEDPRTNRAFVDVVMRWRHT
jgi:DNA-binding sugar fermentation-stimulating protein